MAEADDPAVSGVAFVAVESAHAGSRLDRWFHRLYPDVSHARPEKWLRQGSVRIDGRRAKASDRVETGQVIRVPPLSSRAGDPASAPRKPLLPPMPADPEAIADLAARLLYIDREVLVLDKPAGLSVQGGSGLDRHLDGMLDGLAFDGQRPRLVHRLDRGTSGVLLLARTEAAAAALASAFRSRDVEKLYWAVVAGSPEGMGGEIRLALAKAGGRGHERMVASPNGDQAVTRWRVVARAGRRAAWLALAPLTGRTHQLRAHCALALATPILGDGKYGGAAAYLASDGIARRLHLHARGLVIPHPEGGRLQLAAPLPPHMAATWAFFGFSESDDPAFGHRCQRLR